MYFVKLLNNTLDRVFSGASVFGILIMLLLAGFVSIHALLRSGLNINVTGLFDYSMFALLIFPFITMAYVLRQDKHISVDVITSRLSDKTRASLDVGVYLVSLTFPAILGWKATEWAIESFVSGSMTTSVLTMPKGIFIAVIALGCLLLILQIIRRLVSKIIYLVKYQDTESTPSGITANPIVYILLVICGTIVGLLIFNYWNPVVGLAVVALFLLFCGMPVFLALGFIGCFGIYFLLGSTTLIQVPITAYKSMFSFPLTCLPLFILGGLILEKGKIADQLFTFFELWSGRFRSSLLIATIAVGGLFCAISGSSSATTAVIAAVALPLLVSRGYRRSLSSGVVAGSTIGTLIPPSIGFVIYAVMTEESVAQLFMGALIPGAIIFGFYFLYVILLGIFNKKSLYETGEAPVETGMQQVFWKDRFVALKNAIWGLLTPIIVLGGIYLGVFTPTEAAGILVLYSIILCVFVTRTLKWKDVLTATLRGAEISTMILCIIFAAYVFALVISQMQLAAGLVSWAQKEGLGATAIVVLIFITLFILGMFLDAPACKVITLPLFYPVAMAVGINSLWLGIFYQIILEIGLLTPPVGMNLFVIRAISGIPLGNVVKGVVPFIIMMMMALIIIYLFPELVTWLPETM